MKGILTYTEGHNEGIYTEGLTHEGDTHEGDIHEGNTHEGDDMTRREHTHGGTYK